MAPALRSALSVFLSSALLAAALGSADTVSAASIKSGPLQVTEDGRWAFTANARADSVSRLSIADETFAEILFDGCEPAGLALQERHFAAPRAWVTCPASDRVVVVEAYGPRLLPSPIQLPPGSSPRFAAMSPDEALLLVTLHRADAVAVIDVESRELLEIVPTWRAPLGLTWMPDGRTAWLTHSGSDGANTFVTELTREGGSVAVTARLRIGMQEPQVSAGPEGPWAEGGAVVLRGHPAVQPGTETVWLPAHHANVNEVFISPDSSIQSAIHRLDAGARSVDPRDRLVVSATDVHDPEDPTVRLGPGWDAHVSGPVDVAFTEDGETAYVVHENSGDVLRVPTDLSPVREGRGELLEMVVPPLHGPKGGLPTGVAVVPGTGQVLAYDASGVRVVGFSGLTGSIDFDVTVSDEPQHTRLRFVDRWVLQTWLQGEFFFHSSNDERISANSKTACASCHVDSETDGLVWSFQNREGGAGPRATLSILGMDDTLGERWNGLGQLHRGGDIQFPEAFVGAFQSPQMGGEGLPLEGYYGGTPENPNFSAEAQSLGAYTRSKFPIERSPHRAPDGSLTEAARRGAGMFLGASDALRADADCASCHAPESAFTDRAFHDVGARRLPEEAQLAGRDEDLRWRANTPTLVGVFATAPYDDAGALGSERQHLVDVLADYAIDELPDGAEPHGRVGDLTRRELRDLAEFVLSIDGSTTPEEVATAVDRSPPRLVRVAPTSPFRIEAWFDETVDEGSASDPVNWTILTARGEEVPVLEARWDAREGDKVTLLAELPRTCATETFTVVPGPILDAAGDVSLRAPNALDVADPGNVHSFTLGTELTITLGASGRENVSVAVHDAAIVGPERPTWSHDSPRLTPGGRAFVRFDWQEAFRAATGLDDPSRLVGAAVSLDVDWGELRPVVARRVLKAWDDPRDGDFDSWPEGGPTWLRPSHPRGSWSGPGASALGGTGERVEDYGGEHDLSATADATAAAPSLDEGLTLDGPGMASAYRFWLEHPELDHGHALELADVAADDAVELKLHRESEALSAHAAVLTITYSLPPVEGLEPTPEISAPGSDVPLLVSRTEGAARVSFEAPIAEGAPYVLLEGAMGAWRSHEVRCASTSVAVEGGRGVLEHDFAPGDRYVLAGLGSRLESSRCVGLGAGTDGTPRPAATACP